MAGGRLAAYELTAARSPAPAILAVHGITGNSHSWVPVARALGDRARLVAVDLRGRGHSRRLEGPYGLSAHAEDLLATLDHLGLEQAVLAGHSLGAYIVAVFAAQHPERLRACVLVDGGLKIPGLAVEDPRAAIDAFLGPTLERLGMRFATRRSYLEWWRDHPAIAGSDVDEEDLAAYLNHDLVGDEPELRSGVLAEAVYADGTDLLTRGDLAADLPGPATLLCAPFGLRGEPNPMQPFHLAETWAAASPELRRAILVLDVNHYTITLGRAGARTVADELAQAAAV